MTKTTLILNSVNHLRIILSFHDSALNVLRHAMGISFFFKLITPGFNHYPANHKVRHPRCVYNKLPTQHMRDLVPTPPLTSPLYTTHTSRL